MKILPLSPAPQSASPGLVDYGNTLTPATGGAEQRINRPGSRWRLNVGMPPMQNKELGRVFIARLVRGRSEGVRMKFPLGGFDPGTPGSPVINGAGQAGRVINLRGFSSGYTIKEGQFFSIFSGGAHYLYQADEEISANASGEVSLTVNPMLRKPPADGDVCHFSQPMIEGFIEGSDLNWEIGLDYNIGIDFSIKERK